MATHRSPLSDVRGSLEAHLNALHTQNLALRTRVGQLTAFNNCMIIAAITEYSDYLADDGVTSVTGLDYSGSGTAPDFWALGINPGACGTPATALHLKSSVVVGHSTLRALPGAHQRR
jgi:hypothetical protein